MKKIFYFYFLISALFFKGQINYSATIIDEYNNAVPYVKLLTKNKLFNSDSLGIIRGELKIGDTIHIVDFNFKRKFHVIKNNFEKIPIEERFTEIEPIILHNEQSIKKFSIEKSKKHSFYSIQYDRDYAFLNSTEKKIIFNNIEIPIKNFSDTKTIYNYNTKFSLQFFNEKNGLPNEAITEKIFFSSNSKLKNVKINFKEKIIIPKGHFFVVLKAYENSSKIIDKSVYRFNPFFLTNLDGRKGSYIEFIYKTGSWKIITNERNNFIFNLNYKLFYE